MLKFATLLSVVLLPFTLLAATGAADDPPVNKDAKPPRYKLHVGLELDYEGESEVKFDEGSRLSRSTWKLLVVRQNASGWRVFVRHGNQHQQKSNAADEPQFGKERVVLAWCDVTPDGRVADNPTLDFMLNVRALLPQLPPARQATWQAENALTKVGEEFSQGPPADAEHLTIVDVRKDPIANVYAISEKFTISFDVKRGLVDHLEGEMKQDFGSGSSTQTTRIALKDVKRVDPNLATAVALEMADYFAVKREYDELTERAGLEPANTVKLLAQAKANLEDLRAALITEVLQKQIDEDLARHDLIIKMSEKQAEGLAAVLDKPSPTWQTTDLDGGARSIEACRGKVVVLDFWYRGCGWCIRAMPQIKDVVAHYQGKPVEVLGMNIDDDEADARFVIDKLALNYPTLKAEGLPEKYGVRGYPTLVVIDPSGVVRAVHIGYTPTLAKSLIGTIDKLLAETAAAQ